MFKDYIEKYSQKATQLALNLLVLKAGGFEGATKDPAKTQEMVLFEYLKRNKNTEYGLKYNFPKIKSIKEFQENVPICDFESLHPYLDRMAKGENNIITADKPISFSTTSGSTGKPKLIPTTNYSLGKKSTVLDIWTYYINKHHPEAFGGKILALVSPEVEGFTESGLPYGTESGHQYKNANILLKNIYSLPYCAFDIKNYEARAYSILRIAMEHDVSLIVTLNPKTVILLCEKIEGWQEKLIKDIECGTLSQDFDIPQDIRETITKKLKKNPERAHGLRAIISKKKILLPKYFWPNLKLITCWKAAVMKNYLKELPIFFGHVPIRDTGYLTTETRISIPVTDTGAGGILALKTNFYEFIPKNDIHKKEKRIFLCNQLEKGKEYFVLFTTPGGLFRYNVDDLVRVVGFHNQTPVIEFVERGLDVVTVAGEKIHAFHINEALDKVANHTKICPEFFSAFAKYDHRPHYIFLAEFMDNLSSNEKKEFLKSIDKELHRINQEYARVRKAHLLNPPRLLIVKKGEFEKYRIKKIDQGAPEGQFKMPRLSRDHDFDKHFNINEEISLN